MVRRIIATTLVIAAAVAAAAAALMLVSIGGIITTVILRARTTMSNETGENTIPADTATSASVARTMKKKEKMAHEFKRKRRFHPGTVSLRTIRMEQKSARPLVHRDPFLRFVRHLGPDGARYTANAIDLLRAHYEDHAIRLLARTNDLSVLFGYKTAMPRAMRAIILGNGTVGMR